MNHYIRLPDAKRNLGTTNSGGDAEILLAAEQVSREIDDICQWPLFGYADTRYYQGRATCELWLPDAVTSISSLTVDDDGDDTYELTLAVTTDYFLEPSANAAKGLPYWRIDLNPNGTQLSAWPTYKRGVKVTGIFGFYSTRLLSVTLNEGAGDGNGLDASETSVKLSATVATTLYAGDIIVIDSEQMYVTAVSTDTLTVERGVNGTTAATHSDGAAVRLVTLPAAVTDAAAKLLQRRQWDLASGSSGSIAMTEAGIGSPNRSSNVWGQVKGILRPYANQWAKVG